MKKSVLLLIPLVLLLVMELYYNPILGKLLVGPARIVGNETPCEIVINAYFVN
ncbi:hypothetical protein [Flavobacterium sp. CAU 1735]|uniref:hypothetical protein n=1 Tax=Flavobacterium sp. CAU 1735 TaxID=3140361 RepID=UPI003260961E